MENTSGQKESNTISVYLGEETKYIELPNKAVGKPPRKFVIHPIGLREIAKVETFCGIDFVQWETKNPFTKLSVLLYTLFLSLSRNKEFDMTQDEFEGLFGFPQMSEMFKLLSVILKLSGLESVSPEENKTADVGKNQGAA